MARAALAVVGIAAATGFALRPELAASRTMWIVLVAAYAVLGAVALHKLYDDGTLLDVLGPRWGDISIGIVSAAVLAAAAWLVKRILLQPDSPRFAWLLRISLQVGDTRSAPATVATILGLAALEELVWRGLVLSELAERFGTRRGWIIAAGLYGAAHLPTAFTLSDPTAGPNPLLVLAAVGCGLVWGFVTNRFGRLPPAIASHIAFSWFALPALGVFGGG